MALLKDVDISYGLACVAAGEELKLARKANQEGDDKGYRQHFDNSIELIDTFVRPVVNAGHPEEWDTGQL